MPMLEKLREFLDQHLVEYQVDAHRAVHMRYADFAHLVQPRVAALAEDDQG